MRKDTIEEQELEAISTQTDGLDNVPGDLLISGSLGWTLDSPQHQTSTKKSKNHKNLATMLA